MTYVGIRQLQRIETEGRGAGSCKAAGEAGEAGNEPTFGRPTAGALIWDEGLSAGYGHANVC